MLGGRKRLLDIAAEKDATTVILAIANANSELIRELSELTETAEIRFLILPRFPSSSVAG